MVSDDPPPLTIRYRPVALKQLDAIFSHIAMHNDPAAHRVMSAIKTSIERLRYFLHSARCSEVADIREMPIVRYSYIVFYTVDEDAHEVHFLRVRHTSRDPKNHLAP